MTRDSEKPRARVEIVPAAREQEPVLSNLFELYAHDFSEFFELGLGEDGRFGYTRLPLYWSEPGRHPFFIRVDGKLAGFVLVKRGSDITGDEGVWDVAEFFVARGYRRRGVGMLAAHEVWRRFEGRWEVRVMESNPSAKNFWGRAVGAFTGEAAGPVLMEYEGAAWHLFSFESRGGA